MADQPPPYDPQQPPPDPQQPYPTQPYQQQPYPQQPYPQQGYPPPGYPQQGYPPQYGWQPLPPLAHWGLRVGAYLLDALLLVPGYVVAAVGAAMSNNGGGAVAAVGDVLIVIGYVAIFGVAIWNQIFRQGRTGWSLGKKVVGIRLLSEQSMQPIGPGLTFVRYLAHFLDALPCYIGYLWPLWDAKKQTFADKIMSTVVVVQKEQP
jgi:uncharacterized RDD family membrane protein YckC